MFKADFSKRDKIEFLLIQKLTAMMAGQQGDNPKVVEEAQKRLMELGATDKEISSELYYIRGAYKTIDEKTNEEKCQYEPVISREIKRYESEIA